MSDDNTAFENASQGEILDFYKSLTNDNYVVEREIISKSIEKGVCPDSLRYGEFRGGYRGVIKDTAGQLYYFNLPPSLSFQLIKADTKEKQNEACQLHEKLKCGCDMMHTNKTIEAATEEDEDEEKGPMGGTGTLPPASRPEAQEVATQTSQIMTNHPGATQASTPQQDGSTERWHGSGHLELALPPIDNSTNPNAWNTNQLLKAWGDKLQSTAPRVNPLDPQERKYLVEVLGKTPQEVDSGKARISSQHRAHYNEWLTRSLRTRVGGLVDFLQKSRK